MTDLVLNALSSGELSRAEAVFRLAFGTFVGAPEPENFFSDRDFIRSRHGAPHVAAFAAKIDGEIVGTSFATDWGSVGVLGPLTVHPSFQGHGVARALMSRTMEQFDTWGTRHVGLFTFADSAKHLALYQKSGFHARFLTAVMSKAVLPDPRAKWSRFSSLPIHSRDEVLRSCRAACGSVLAGLDLSDEITSTIDQELGEVVLIEDGSGIAAFGICHFGPASEAGADACYVKFGLSSAGPLADRNFSALLDGCEALASSVGMPNLVAGANLGRVRAYRELVARGFRTVVQGVAMHRNNDPAYSVADAYVLDDWR